MAGFPRRSSRPRCPVHARRVLLMAGAGLALLGAAAVLDAIVRPSPRFVWNLSASAPLGLYVVSSKGEIAAGDTVIARVPALWRLWAGRRRYIPINVPLVKRVAAIPGDSVCAIGTLVQINGRGVAIRRLSDGRGRDMPDWHGCTTLGQREYLLLGDGPDSFDGRYFGPTGRNDIIGKAHRL